ncbi:MAG TPA: SemiSWEET family transporter [Candidatus Paceibacterota bacterium]|nr:SemiSWEET family transporter [Candidatus Paceibacterota bacterium]
MRGGGLRLASKRKRESKEKQNFKKFILDEVAYPVGFMAALANVPQIIEIWRNKSAGDLSLTAWICFASASIFWFYYSLVHREKALVFAFALTFFLEVIIVFGILYYR